jgi:exodeoxyribonuclease V alpha subunit
MRNPLLIKKSTPSETAAKSVIATRKDDILYGTGITKRIAEQANRAVEKQDMAALKTMSLMQLIKKSKEPQAANATEAARNTTSENFEINENSQSNDLINGSEIQQIIKNINDEIDEPPVLRLAPAPSDVQLDEFQLAALAGLSQQKYGVLIGAAGTGKTTTIKQLVRQLENTLPTINLNTTKLASAIDEKAPEQYNVAICFCAFTGRAVQQMKLNLPPQFHPMANTVHATLGYAPVMEDFLDEDTQEWRERRIFRPSFTVENKLPFKICVLDEGGMMNIPLTNELLAALPDDCRIIIIGDINQLTPIMGKSALGYAMIKWPVYALEKLHRNAGVIAEQAHNILQGFYPTQDKEKFVIMKLPDGSLSAYDKVINVIKYMSKNGTFDPFQDALIVPQNKEVLGQLNINEELVRFFNPEKPDKTNRRIVITTGLTQVTYAVDDKIMLLQNDRKRSLSNGMMGRIVDISLNGEYDGNKGIGTHDAVKLDSGFSLDLTNLADDLHVTVLEDDGDINQRASSHVVTAVFNNGTEDLEVTFSTAGQYRTLCHAYAMTCHKMQGSEARTVVIVCHSANARMLTREWLYTAATRAKFRVVILANDRGLQKAIQRQEIKGKTIADKIKTYTQFDIDPDEPKPNFPEPKLIASK